MAKIDFKKMEDALFKRTEGYAANVRAVYLSSMRQIIDIIKNTDLEAGKPFSFAGYGYSDQVNPLLRAMYSQVYQIIRGGVEKEWLNANDKNDGLVKAVFGAKSIEDSHFARYFMRNKDAMDAFFARKSQYGGLNLSQRVWRYTGAFREELENTLDLAIGEGIPANSLATKIQQYLQDPDRWYRRFRVKVGEQPVVDDEGNPVIDPVTGKQVTTPIYGRKWKRRVYDKATQSYKWIDAKPSDYHPGRGVYRSSYRNAQRLARTETNMAYRTSDYLRWGQLDFVIGIEIKLSNNHPITDICDDLKGRYPKDFKWVGWHPNCRCYAVPVMASEDEMWKMADNILEGKDPSVMDIEGEVTHLPKNFTDWVDANQDRIEQASKAGTLPYFIKDNQNTTFGVSHFTAPPTIEEIAKARHDARTPEQAAKIAKEWHDRQATYKYGTSILNYMDGISDVDTSALAKALQGGDYGLVLAEAKKLRDIGKEILALDKLDNPMEVAKNFSMAEAKAVNDAVTAKLASLLTGDLATQVHSLQFEIDWVTKYKKYSTWEVAANAYKKALAQVETKIKVEGINDTLTILEANIKSSAYKGTKAKSLINDAKAALAKNDVAAAEKALKEAKDTFDKWEKKQLAKSGGSIEAYCAAHYTEDFTVTSQASYDRVMQMLGDCTKDAWQKATDEQRAAFPWYTNDSSNSRAINTATGFGRPHPKIKDMDAILDKISTKEDMVLRSGQNYCVAGFVFGSDFEALLSAGRLSELNAKYAGTIGHNKAFMSTSFNQEGGFSKEFEVHIFAPKGTHCMNLNELSYFGHNLGTAWDGVSYHSSWDKHGETEIFLHRGYKWKFIRAEAGTGFCGRNRIYVQLLDQVK